MGETETQIESEIVNTSRLIDSNTYAYAELGMKSLHTEGSAARNSPLNGAISWSKRNNAMSAVQCRDAAVAPSNTRLAVDREESHRAFHNAYIIK